MENNIKIKGLAAYEIKFTITERNKTKIKEILMKFLATRGFPSPIKFPKNELIDALNPTGIILNIYIKPIKEECAAI